jgi:hypothetical protein
MPCVVSLAAAAAAVMVTFLASFLFVLLFQEEGVEVSVLIERQRQQDWFVGCLQTGVVGVWMQMIDATRTDARLVVVA